MAATASLAAPPRRPQVLRPERLGQWRSALYRVALRLTRSHADADDLVQETYLRVLARPRMIHGGEELPYLERALRNTFVSQRRGVARAPVTSLDDPDRARLEPATKDDPLVGALGRELRGAIAELPQPQRNVVVLVDVLGLSYGEAAASLGVPPGTVMSRLHRGRRSAARTLVAGGIR